MSIFQLFLFSEGRLALHYSAANSHIACIETLVVTGSSIDHKDSAGMTPLHVASCQVRLQSDRFTDLQTNFNVICPYFDV